MLPLEHEGILLDTSEQAPAPSKDFVNLLVNKTEVHWRIWKINPHCLHPDVRVAPVEKKQSHQDFLHDLDMQADVRRYFSNNMVEYVKGLCSGHFDYFVRISSDLQIYIMSFLELEDIAHLATTSKHFYELCKSEKLWEHIVETHCDTVTEEMKEYAAEVGWKHVFFTNKLQLQAQMRRHQKRSVYPSKD